MDTSLYSMGAFFSDEHPDLVDDVIAQSEAIEEAGIRGYSEQHGISAEALLRDAAHGPGGALLQRGSGLVKPFIGLPRFELGTSPTRTERATRLRHSPWRDQGTNCSPTARRAPPRARGAVPRPRRWARCRTAVRPTRSVTTVSVVNPSIRGRATPASTGVTRPIQSEESVGESSGTLSLGRGRLSMRRGHPVEHLAVGQHLGAADLDLSALRFGHVGRGREVGHGVVHSRRAGWAVSSHFGAIITGSRCTR